MLRLDPKGRLLVPPDDDDIYDGTWVGEPTGTRMLALAEGAEPQRVTDFESVMIGDDFISVGDSIYLTPDSEGDLCEIGRVKSMFEIDADSEKSFEVQWFWRPEHIKNQEHLDFDEHEVCISDLIDTNPIEAFEGKVSVQQIRDEDTPPPRAPHSFFFKRNYNPSDTKITMAEGSESIAAASSGNGKAGSGKAKGGGGKAAASGGKRKRKVADADGTSQPKAARGTAPARAKMLEQFAGASGAGAAATVCGMSPRLAMRKLEEHMKSARNASRTVQKELMKLANVPVKDIVAAIGTTREKHEELLKAITALDSLIDGVSRGILEGAESAPTHGSNVGGEGIGDTDIGESERAGPMEADE